MAHTDHHDEIWFWKDHFDNHCTIAHRPEPRSCWCERHQPGSPWARYRWFAPRTAWNRHERRVERAALRSQLRRARNGQLDWDDLPGGDCKLYRRPYFD